MKITHFVDLKFTRHHQALFNGLFIRILCLMIDKLKEFTVGLYLLFVCYVQMCSLLKAWKHIDPNHVYVSLCLSLCLSVKWTTRGKDICCCEQNKRNRYASLLQSIVLGLPQTCYTEKEVQEGQLRTIQNYKMERIRDVEYKNIILF